MTNDLSYKPNVLYLASIERIDTAGRLIDAGPRHSAAVAYLSGLAVECILQAVALHNGATHDASHSLPRWLAKCPATMNDALKRSAQWNEVVALWDNGIRYLSFDGLLGYYRNKGAVRGKKGGVESRVRVATKSLFVAADVVHKKGIAQWLSTRK